MRPQAQKARILVVDDDATVSDVVERYLARAGFVVDRARDGHAALAVAQARPPDLVVLDLMLPGMSGLDVCHALRERSDVPVVMLTAFGEEADKVVGFEVGADDYVTKPFSPRELALRVQSVLRRARPTAPADATPLVDGDLVVDVRARTAERAGRPLNLTLREFDLLVHMMRHPRQAFGRDELLKEVWGWDFGERSTVTVHVRRLREKIEVDARNPQRLLTVWGVGYRYEPARPGA